MFTKRTIIGLVVGSIIIGIGFAALITSFGLQTLDLEETIEIGKSLPYTIKAPESTVQFMNITGDKFDVTLSSPVDGLQIPLSSYKDELKLEWTHLEDGVTNIKIQNTGSSELTVNSLLKVSTDPILFAYHFIVITAGVIIIGFSLGFSIRKPKGF